MNSIFLDTSPLIYYLDGSEPFASKVERFLLSVMNSGKELHTSTITDTEADKAVQIRAKYKGIKTADSLQLASAIVSECDVFLTNDKQLRQVEEIQVLLVDDL